jgi:rod shape determining protein RodA
MKAYVRTFGQKIRSLDMWLLIPTVVLSILSMLTLVGGIDNFGPSTAITQALAFLAGMFACIFLAMIDYSELIDKLYIVLFFAAVGMLTITLIFGVAEGENMSWFTIPGIGVTVQPSEFVKVLYIATFSKHLQTVGNRINRLSSIIPLALHALIIIGLVLFSGDLGVALIYIAITAVMLYCAGLSIFYFLGVALIAVIVFPYLWPMLAEYQQKRILVGFNPESDPLGYGMQSLLSLNCIASGGFLGKGLGNGELYADVPVSNSDFVFATYCEQFGILGSIIYMILLLTIIIRLIILAKKSRDALGSFICAGVIAIIVSQSLENLGMALATLPVIGITLPFMSSGGSSMLAVVALMGLPMSVSMHKNERLKLNKMGELTKR